MSHWVERLDGGPHRSFHAAVAAGDRLFSFGGWEGKTSSVGALTPGQMEVHVFSTVSMRWRTLPPVAAPGRREAPLEVPSARCYHTAVLIGDVVYVWGGYTNTWSYSNQLYAFNIHTHGWRKPTISGAVPREMKGHSACVLAKVMYIYGTWDRWNVALGYVIPRTDIYKLDTITMVWSLIKAKGTAPSVSQFHSVTAIGTKMFVFGGCRNEEDYSAKEGCYSDVRVFDTETNSWLSTPSAQLHPEGRCCHSAFAYNGELYIFGGRTWERATYDDLWKFNAESSSWKKVGPKGKRHPSGRYGTCCCVVGDRTVLFGGECDTGAFDDLYVLDLSPSLKTLCKLAVSQHGLEHSGLPQDIRWEFRCAQR